MKKKRLSKSIRKYIRLEKAKIRREVSDSKEREKLIEEIYQKIITKDKKNKEKQKHENTGDLQPGNK